MKLEVNEVVLVVHGVGDPAPGETLALLARSTSDPSHPLIENDEVIWLHEASGDGASGEGASADRRFESTFPCHTRTRETAAGRTLLAEVFWGDLSQVRRGFLGTLRGLFEIIFGLRYVAFVGAAQPCASAWLLQRAGVWLTRLLHGPVLAVNLMLLCLFLTMAVSEINWDKSTNGGIWTSTMVATLSAALLMAGLTAWRKARNPICEQLFFWFAVAALMLGVQLGIACVSPQQMVAQLELAETSPDDALGKIHALTAEVGKHVARGDRIVCIRKEDGGFVDLTSTMNGRVSRVNVEPGQTIHRGQCLLEIEHGLTWYIHAFVVTLSYLWFSLMAVIAWMAAVWLFSRTNQRLNRRGLNVALLLPIITVGIWGQLLPMFWLMAKESLRRGGQIEQLDDMFGEAVPLLGVQFVMGIVLGLVQVLVFFHYMIWRPRNTVESYRLGNRPPRLIVNVWVQFCSALCACIGVTAVFLIGWNELMATEYWRGHFLELIGEANRYGLLLLMPLTGLYIVAFRYLGGVVDIVLDVVNHFSFRRHPQAPRASRFADEFDEDPASLWLGRLSFECRRTIQGRMKQQLAYFAASCGNGPPALTVVSHSQGTMIAIEVLNDPQMDWLRQAFSQIRLVTMGSPFSHIYQYYFGHQYPRLDQPYWSNLRQRVDRWSNIFRVDDFVGTEIEYPAGLAASGGPHCENLPVECSGHNNYWSDRQVIHLLRNHLQFAWLAASCGSGTADDHSIPTENSTQSSNESPSSRRAA